MNKKHVMRQVTALVLMLLLSIPSCITAAGAPNENSFTAKVKFNAVTREVTISGAAEADSVISMMVIADNEDGTAAATPDTVQNIVFAALQTTAGKDDRYSQKFTFDKKDNNSRYAAIVYSKTDGKRERVGFYMPDDISEMLAAFNGANESGMYAVAEKYATVEPVLNFSLADYERYPNEVSAIIVEEAAKEAFKSNLDIEDAINAALGEVNLRHSDAEATQDLLKQYAEILGIELDINYETIKADAAQIFVDLRADEPSAEVVDLAVEAMAVAAVNNAKKTEIESVLRRYNDSVFGLDLSAYSTFDPVEIAKALYDKGYKKASEVLKDYKDRVTELNTEKKNNNKGGNNSGTNAGKGYTTDNKIRVDGDYYTDSVELYQLPFTDLGNVEWAKEYIKKLYAMGIITGVSENSYDPDAPVKRSEISKMMVKVLETEIVIGENPFTDVPEGAWYTDFVINAYENGLITGYDGKFEPESYILRRDLALIVSRALEANGYSVMAGAGFNDITAADEYAKAAIESLAAYGVIDGTGNGGFSPANYVTRAEAAKIICNMMEVLAGE